ncbi:MAG: hypothetical protein IKX36_10465 [Prevotella sp.]|nr:hypothetical protein [Prevotella sp.]
MKKYIKPEVKNVSVRSVDSMMQTTLDEGTFPTFSMHDEEGDEGAFSDEYIFEEEMGAYNKNYRYLNVWER